MMNSNLLFTGNLKDMCNKYKKKNKIKLCNFIALMQESASQKWRIQKQSKEILHGKRYDHY